MILFMTWGNIFLCSDGSYYNIWKSDKHTFYQICSMFKESQNISLMIRSLQLKFDDKCILLLLAFQLIYRHEMLHVATWHGGCVVQHFETWKWYDNWKWVAINFTSNLNYDGKHLTKSELWVSEWLLWLRDKKLIVDYWMVMTKLWCLIMRD